MTAVFPTKPMLPQRRRRRSANWTNAGNEQVWKILNSPAALPSARRLRTLEMRSPLT